MSLQLTNVYKLTGTLRCVTGLHIGAGQDNIEIGGTDRPVILHPIERYPYIPGSSLKGKLRSLIELRYGEFGPDGGPTRRQTGDHGFVGRIFGISAGDETGQVPTALIVRDAVPNERYGAEFRLRRQQGQQVLEQKSENTINRIDSSANPRTIERVPAGAEFAFEATYRVFAVEGDDAQSQDDFRHVLEAMALLELDTLGGHGSRGYGRVEFLDDLQCVDMSGNPVPLDALGSYLTAAAQA